MAYCLTGKDRVWRGQPLLFRVEGAPASTGSPANVQLMLTPTGGPFTGEPVRPALRSPELLPEIVVVDTRTLEPGSYEVALSVNGADASPEEIVSVLEGDDYLAILRHEVSEEFLPEPTVSSDSELRTLLDRILDRSWIGTRPEIQVSWQALRPVAACPIDWVASTMVASLRYLAVFGVEQASGFVSVGFDRLEIGFDVTFRRPLTDSVIQAMRNESYSDLVFLAGQGGFDGFELELKIERTRARIAVRHAVPELEFA